MRNIGAIQDLYPNPPVLRYHRLAPKIEREFGETAPLIRGGGEFETTISTKIKTMATINWLDIAVAFLLGYLIGGRYE